MKILHRPRHDICTYRLVLRVYFVTDPEFRRVASFGYKTKSRAANIFSFLDLYHRIKTDKNLHVRIDTFIIDGLVPFW